jgi:hypothetical protein
MSQPRSQPASQRSEGERDEPERRVELVRDYANIVQELRQSEEQLINSQSPSALTERLERQNRLFARVKTPTTMAHDCDGLSRIMRITVSQAAAVNLYPRSLNLQNVRASLVRRFGAGALDLEALGDWALRRSRVAPAGTAFLFGLGQFHPAPRARTQRARTQRDAPEEARAVDQRELGEGRANQLLVRARGLCDRLKRAGATPLVRAIATPVGFAQTVQNAFDFSHLVRDGRAGLRLISGCVFATAEVELMQQGDRRHQCVLHLRQSDYQRCVDDPETKAQLIGNPG